MAIEIFRHLTEKRVVRFWSRVAVGEAGECWPWLGRLDPVTEYGLLSIEPRGSGKTLNLLAHRVSLTLSLGRDLVLPQTRHSCHFRRCCNAGHLSEGTAMDNRMDSVRSGRPILGAGLATDHLRGIYGVHHPASRYSAETRARAIHLWSVERMTRGAIAKLIGCRLDTVSRWLWEAFPDSLAMPMAARRVRLPVDRDG